MPAVVPTPARPAQLLGGRTTRRPGAGADSLDAYAVIAYLCDEPAAIKSGFEAADVSPRDARFTGRALATADLDLLDVCHTEQIGFVALPGSDNTIWSLAPA